MFNWKEIVKNQQWREQLWRANQTWLSFKVSNMVSYNNKNDIIVWKQMHNHSCHYVSLNRFLDLYDESSGKIQILIFHEDATKYRTPITVKTNVTQVWNCDTTSVEYQLMHCSYTAVCVCIYTAYVNTHTHTNNNLKVSD